MNFWRVLLEGDRARLLSRAQILFFQSEVAHGEGLLLLSLASLLKGLQGRHHLLLLSGR